MRLSTFFTALKTQALVVGATMVVGAAGIGMAMTGSPNPAVWGSRLMSDLTSGPGGGHGAQNGIIVADPNPSASQSPEARPSPEPSESPSAEPTQKPETSAEGTAPSGGEPDTEHSPTPYPTQTPEPVPSHSPSDEGGSGGE